MRLLKLSGLLKILFVFIALNVSVSGNYGKAHAEEISLARQIAEALVSEKSYFAIRATTHNEIRSEFRKLMDGITDIGSLTDRDLDTYLQIVTEQNAKGFVAGMQKAFQNKMEQLDTNDQKILLSCAKKLVCNRKMISADAQALIAELPEYGRKKGFEIGRAVGVATNSAVIAKIEESDPDRFDNRDELLRILRMQVF